MPKKVKSLKITLIDNKNTNIVLCFDLDSQKRAEGVVDGVRWCIEQEQIFYMGDYSLPCYFTINGNKYSNEGYFIPMKNIVAFDWNTNFELE